MGKVKTQTYPYDSAEYLDTEAAQAEYLTAAIETEDAAFIADAIGVIARARGMTQVAKDAGLGRESLYKSLRAGGNPTFSTVLRVLKALRMDFQVKPRDVEP
jgi:probable addiction module antidote protein